MIKKRVIVDYKNVPEEVLQALHEKYPHGYSKGIIKFTNAKNEVISAVSIEIDDVAYMVKVSTQLQKMVDNVDIDDDFDPLGDVALDDLGDGLKDVEDELEDDDDMADDGSDSFDEALDGDDDDDDDDDDE